MYNNSVLYVNFNESHFLLAIFFWTLVAVHALLLCMSPCMCPRGCGRGFAGGLTGSRPIGAARGHDERACDHVF